MHTTGKIKMHRRLIHCPARPKDAHQHWQFQIKLVQLTRQGPATMPQGQQSAKKGRQREVSTVGSSARGCKAQGPTLRAVRPVVPSKGQPPRKIRNRDPGQEQCQHPLTAPRHPPLSEVRGAAGHPKYPIYPAGPGVQYGAAAKLRPPRGPPASQPQCPQADLPAGRAPQASNPPGVPCARKSSASSGSQERGAERAKPTAASAEIQVTPAM
ncbi:hypothetical protein NDU88_004662 [Pleurodeles waltl]|uniref:Uncharacterized protein n=1 Tax=Pleurodeles waltl TaxID=8319 RepID=A0AAV7UH35_PLEWA|nr:hypothetical protein NDU88_004662 [Pleurodeles waltl]